MLVSELLSLAASLFGLDPASTSLALNSQPLLPELTLAAAGVSDCDLLLLVAAQRNPVPDAMNLDFSSILGGIGSAGGGSMSGVGGGTAGGLNLIPPQLTRANSTAVEWAGMNLDDVFNSNRNPQHIVSIIRSHPNVRRKPSHAIILFALFFFSVLSFVAWYFGRPSSLISSLSVFSFSF